MEYELELPLSEKMLTSFSSKGENYISFLSPIFDGGVCVLVSFKCCAFSRISWGSGCDYQVPAEGKKPTGFLSLLMSSQEFKLTFYDLYLDVFFDGGESFFRCYYENATSDCFNALEGEGVFVKLFYDDTFLSKSLNGGACLSKSLTRMPSVEFCYDKFISIQSDDYLSILVSMDFSCDELFVKERFNKISDMRAQRVDKEIYRFSAMIEEGGFYGQLTNNIDDIVKELALDVDVDVPDSLLPSIGMVGKSHISFKYSQGVSTALGGLAATRQILLMLKQKQYINSFRKVELTSIEDAV